MAKLVAVALAAWLVASVCSTELTDRALEPTGYWADQIKLANDRMSKDDGTLSFGEALLKFQEVGIEYESAAIKPKVAKDLIRFDNINQDDCHEAGLISKEFSHFILGTICMKIKYPLLSKHVKASLDNYMKLCGFEDRYKDFVQQSMRNKFGKPRRPKKVSLAGKLLRDSFCLSKNHEDDLLWAISLMKDPNFGRAGGCNNKRFLSKIAQGLALRYAGRFAHEVLDRYLKICGNQDRFKLVADKFVKDENVKYPNLARYIHMNQNHNSNLKKGHYLYTLITVIDYLATFDPTEGRNCYDFSLLDGLVETIRKAGLFSKFYPQLSEYSQHLLDELLKTCGFKSQFKHKVAGFIADEPKRWTKISCFTRSMDYHIKQELATQAGYLELVESNVALFGTRYILDNYYKRPTELADACLEFWNRTYGSLVDLRMNDDHSVENDKKLESWLHELDYCAIILNKNHGYTREFLADLRQGTVKRMVSQSDHLGNCTEL